MTLPLYPATPEWDAAWSLATADQFIQRKTDRARRMREHEEYVSAWLLHAFRQPRGLVIDVGPGCGELLELARHAGHEVLGVDAPDGAGGMGDAYLRACRLMHQRQKLPVVYERFLDWIADDLMVLIGRCVAINFRGSWEQTLSDMMAGMPHDRHHDAKRLAWRETPQTVDAVCVVMRRLSELLRPGGVVCIHCNGAQNHAWMSGVMDDAAQAAGLRFHASDGDRLKAWVR